MPSYAIISQEPFGEKTRFKVILKADDGYQEEQEYVGDETTLEEAAKHFNSEWLASKAQSVEPVAPVVEEPVFVEINAAVDEAVV